MRLSVLATSLALSPVLLAQARVPEAEPNNTAATAQLIQVGNQIDCSLVPGDYDWFRFTLASAGRIRVHTTGGNVELQFFVPGSTALRGMLIWEQGVDLDATAPNGLFAQPGNYGFFIIGERTY